MSDENPNATTNMAIVIPFRTRRVSQVCDCNHDRAPLAPAAAAITHPAHMPAS
jgi:hypothetical protein